MVQVLTRCLGQPAEPEDFDRFSVPVNGKIYCTSLWSSTHVLTRYLGQQVGSEGSQLLKAPASKQIFKQEFANRDKNGVFADHSNLFKNGFTDKGRLSSTYLCYKNIANSIPGIETTEAPKGSFDMSSYSAWRERLKRLEKIAQRQRERQEVQEIEVQEAHEGQDPAQPVIQGLEASIWAPKPIPPAKPKISKAIPIVRPNEDSESSINQTSKATRGSDEHALSVDAAESSTGQSDKVTRGSGEQHALSVDAAETSTNQSNRATKGSDDHPLSVDAAAILEECAINEPVMALATVIHKFNAEAPTFYPTVKQAVAPEKPRVDSLSSHDWLAQSMLGLENFKKKHSTIPASAPPAKPADSHIPLPKSKTEAQKPEETLSIDTPPTIPVNLGRIPHEFGQTAKDKTAATASGLKVTDPLQIDRAAVTDQELVSGLDTQKSIVAPATVSERALMAGVNLLDLDNPEQAFNTAYPQFSPMIPKLSGTQAGNEMGGANEAFESQQVWEGRLSSVEEERMIGIEEMITAVKLFEANRQRMELERQNKAKETDDELGFEFEVRHSHS